MSEKENPKTGRRLFLSSRSAVRSPDQHDHHALDDEFRRRDEPGVSGVLGFELGRFAAFLEERFERAFVVDERGHDIAVPRRESVFQHDEIAVDDVAADHGIPAHLQRERARRRLETQRGDVDRNAALGFLAAILGKPGRDASVNRDVRHRLAQMTQRRQHAQRPGAAGLVVQRAFPSQGAHVIRRRLGAFETKVARDFAQGRPGAVRLVNRVDEIQDLLLACSDRAHTIQLNSSLARRVGNSEMPGEVPGT